MKLLVDGVFFQLADSGIARVWTSILGDLATDERFTVSFLDRGNAPAIEGMEYIPFPRYSMRSGSQAADSTLIQRVCDHYRIDAFTSTYYTSPLSTPMLLVVYDMIPELFGFDLRQRPWMEKQVAISYAQRFMAISHNTRQDLLALYPEIAPGAVTVAHCGVDSDVFRPRESNDVLAFRKAHGLDRAYFLFVGSRVQHGGYKNSKLFVDTLESIHDADFDILCVGGEEEIEQEVIDRLPPGVACQRVTLDDADLACAYSGARALVYPSLYEGFGMPVIEAMASGCPVITTHHGSLAEAAGDAALLVSGHSLDEMRRALDSLRDETVRTSLRNRGLAHARRFRWNNMAAQIGDDVAGLVEDAAKGHFDAFFEQWRSLREIQASVDFQV